MEKYTNVSGITAVVSYEISDTFIEVKFYKSTNYIHIVTQVLGLKM